LVLVLNHISSMVLVVWDDALVVNFDKWDALLRDATSFLSGFLLFFLICVFLHLK